MADTPVTPEVLRVRIDASRCDGQGVCKTVAPELFELDRYGYAYVLRDRADLDPADRDAIETAKDAESMCPRAAIFLERRQLPVSNSPTDGHSALSVAEPSRVTRLLNEVSLPSEESLGSWRSQGGFRRSEAGSLTNAVREVGLRGYGGAGYPVALKWAAIARAGGIVVVNGAEREPGTLKDAYLLSRRPFLVIDGALSIAHEVGCGRVVVALPEGEEALRSTLTTACEAVTEEGLTDGVTLQVVEVPRAYIAGEETALLAALQDQAVRPRLRPPYPAQSGLYGGPTLVHNAETVAQTALLKVHGPDWFRSIGHARQPGSGIFSVGAYGSDSFELYERPFGYPLDALIAEAGFASSATAALVGGYSGGLIPAGSFNVALEESALRGLGARLGTKSVQVLTDQVCPLRLVVEVLDFFSQETAAQCPPCYRGLPDMRDIAASLDRGEADGAVLEEFRHYMETLPGRNICALPDGAAILAMSYLRNFDGDVRHHLDAGCPLGGSRDASAARMTA